MVIIIFDIKKIKNPVFYIIIGAFVALVVLVYLLRRFVHASPGSVVVIVRRGKIIKILTEKDQKYCRAPFLDSIGAIIMLNDKSFVSDKLFINDGPDRLYRINFNLFYRVNDPKLYFEHLNGFQEIAECRINDCLRLFADNGNAKTLIENYRSNEKKILDVINASLIDLGVEALSFKINYIEPMGK